MYLESAVMERKRTLEGCNSEEWAGLWPQGPLKVAASLNRKLPEESRELKKSSEVCCHPSGLVTDLH